MALCSTPDERVAHTPAAPAGGAPPHQMLNTEHSLALSVFQVKVWVEVDQNPLVRSWSCNHPYAFLRRVVRHRITGWSEVTCSTDVDIAPTFVWKNRKERKYHSCWKHHCWSPTYNTLWCVFGSLWDATPDFLSSWTRFIRKIMLIDQPHLLC